jgi:hypothetical protein
MRCCRTTFPPLRGSKVAAKLRVMHYLEKALKRVFSLSVVIVIAVILTTDIGMIMKYHQKPNAYSLMENISFIHFFLLHKNGYSFALIKLLFSVLLLMSWAWRVIHPTKIYLLSYATSLYSFFWLCVGALILSGMVGALQYSAGLPVNLFNPSLLVSSIPFGSLLLLVLMVVGLPLVMMGLPKLHNRALACANA